MGVEPLKAFTKSGTANVGVVVVVVGAVVVVVGAVVIVVVVGEVTVMT
jgi:hypothetical protein